MISLSANRTLEESQDVIIQTIPSFVGLLGFTLLQIGLCQPKNSTSIIIINVTSSCIAILSSWVIGFALAFGSASNSFASYSMFFLINADHEDMITWISYCSLVVLFTAICNGGFIERMSFPVYAATTTFLTGIIFPIGCHWCWHPNGWIHKGLKNSIQTIPIQYYEAGGTGPVHISAGSIAFFGGLFLKQRTERKASWRFHLVPGKTNVNVFFGGIMVLISLLSFKMIFPNIRNSYTNGIISCSTSSLVAIMFKRSRIAGEISNVRTLINGALTGLIAVSSGASFHPYASFGIGMAAGIVYIGWSVALKHFRFDDAVDTVAVHLGGGIWGVLAMSLIDKSKGVLYVATIDSFRWFGWSLVVIIVYFAWNGFATAILMLPLHRRGKLKYDEEVHRKGIDECIHKEPAYPDVQILSLNTPFGDFNKIGKDERKSRKQKDELHDIIELDNFGLSENLPTN